MKTKDIPVGMWGIAREEAHDLPARIALIKNIEPKRHGLPQNILMYVEDYLVDTWNSNHQSFCDKPSMLLSMKDAEKIETLWRRAELNEDPAKRNYLDPAIYTLERGVIENKRWCGYLPRSSCKFLQSYIKILEETEE